ncbi:VOC family protein, partial [Isoptericola sp. NPDC060257]|uniref:VOC family protein n=1 Tax=Isoptericola sp. NPDC060257 TaxID=3347087 RepID=UPI003658C885
MLRGLTTITYLADDVAAARDWYAEVLGTEAYFAREAGGALAYAEFRVGDYQHELGIMDRRFAPPQPDGAAGAVAYWAGGEGGGRGAGGGGGAGAAARHGGAALAPGGTPAAGGAGVA